MNIKLSKSQWEMMGKKAGWMKKAQTQQPQPQPQQPQQNQPQQNQPQQTPDASKWTFNKLMQDPNFKKTFETIKKQRENEMKILKYWESIGIQYTRFPEILEVIG